MDDDIISPLEENDSDILVRDGSDEHIGESIKDDRGFIEAFDSIPEEKHESVAELSGIYPETVCGRDDRTEWTSIDGGVSPDRVRGICHLGITFPGGRTGGCTGFRVSRNLVLTAAHCIFSRNLGAFATSIVVRPGRMRGHAAPFGQFVSNRFFFHPAYPNTGDPRRDFGAIVLPLGADLQANEPFYGFYKLGSYEPGELPSLVRTWGYPGDKPFGTLWRAKPAAPTRRDGNRLQYSVDTFGGQSGSPLFRIKRHNVPPGDKDHPVAYGIHTNGGCPNSGVIFGDLEMAFILDWMGRA